MSRKMQMPEKIDKSQILVRVVEASEEIQAIAGRSDSAPQTNSIKTETYNRLLEHNVKRFSPLLKALHDYDSK